jgi:hypothetical protein
MRCLATFETTHMALKFEKNCRKAGLDVRVIPLPRELSSSCGLACSYPCDSRGAVDEIVRSARIDAAGFYEIE